MENTEPQQISQEPTPPTLETPTPQPEPTPIIESPTLSTEPTQAPVLPPQATQEPQPNQPSPKSFLAKALESIQFRKKAKLEKIMKLANEKKSITNDQVQKLLRISDATATRYLSELVRQNKLKRTGITTNIRYEPTLGSNGGN